MADVNRRESIGVKLESSNEDFYFLSLLPANFADYDIINYKKFIANKIIILKYKFQKDESIFSGNEMDICVCVCVCVAVLIFMMACAFS